MSIDIFKTKVENVVKALYLLRKVKKTGTLQIHMNSGGIVGMDVIRKENIKII